MKGPDLLELAGRGVEAARRLGATEAEVGTGWFREASVEVQKNDLHTASTSEETNIGIRVFVEGGLGFATVNDPARMEAACAEAVALARAAPRDPGNALGLPRPAEPLPDGPDPALGEIDVETLVGLASRMLDRVAAKDRRVMIDSGAVTARIGARALATSTGTRLSEDGARAGLSLFGMAVDDGDIGSFDTEGHAVRRREDLEPELDAAADRFVIKTVSALGAKKGETFRGPVVLSPEVVREFVVAHLLQALDGKSVRTGRSPFRGRLGEAVASPLLDLADDARRPQAAASTAFDREGTPTRAVSILDRGVLRTFLYDVYEARAAGVEPTGHARGGVTSLPQIGPSNLELRAGDESFTRLCCDPERCVVVSRFSGSCNPVTGEFSGVVKGGFLMRHGQRTPIKETLIAGNLYDLLKSVSGVSREIRDIGGHSRMPALRVEDISVTAG